MGCKGGVSAWVSGGWRVGRRREGQDEEKRRVGGWVGSLRAGVLEP